MGDLGGIDLVWGSKWMFWMVLGWFGGNLVVWVVLSFFISNNTESINVDHHLRCGGWLNFEFSKREKNSGWAIKTIYKKLNRDILKHIPLNQ